MRIIAGIQVEIAGKVLNHWEIFRSKENAAKKLFVTESNIPFASDNVTSASVHNELKVNSVGKAGWMFETPINFPPVQLYVNSEYDRVKYFLPDCSDREGQQVKLNHFLRTAFECRFCFEGIVSLHAACVEKDGFAVAFTGNSGVGKSTRARAWVEGLGAEWISGDRPAVRLEKEGSVACGVPWDGKEQIFRNVEVPLKAILDVRRANSNYVRKLSGEQARAVLMRQTFVPMWDTDAAVMAMANVRRLIKNTPVYRVFCGPEAEDAREIYDILYNRPEKILEEEKEMKVKDGFVLRNVVDEYIVMPTGENIAKFDGAVVLNEVSAFVFEQMKQAVSREDLLAAVLNEFEVDEATAAADLDVLLKNLTEMGLIEA